MGKETGSWVAIYAEDWQIIVVDVTGASPHLKAPTRKRCPDPRRTTAMAVDYRKPAFCPECQECPLPDCDTHAMQQLVRKRRASCK